MEQFIIRNTKGILVDLRSNIFDPKDNFMVLENINRFGGRVRFSVADHIRLGLSLCKNEQQKKFFLLHEGFEGFSGLDVPKPIKHSWPWYVKREKEYLEFLYKFHRLDYSEYAYYVYDLDTLCYEIEAEFFFGDKISHLDHISTIIQNPYSLYDYYLSIH
jgi:hypothetical protein